MEVSEGSHSIGKVLGLERLLDDKVVKADTDCFALDLCEDSAPGGSRVV